MGLLRSERWSALLLIAAAAAGLILANTPAGAGAIAISHFQLGYLSAAHWVTDGLLAIFFFLAAVELKHELTKGELRSVRLAIIPASAAVGGVVVPALSYLAIVHDSSLARGWPIPTATDIAFALGILGILGGRLPSRVRALLLALAVLDDLVAIAIIAIFYTSTLQWLPLVGSIPLLLCVALLSRVRQRWWTVALLVLAALGVWVLVSLSGIHPTVAGVAVGLVIASKPGGIARHALEPVSNGIILPLFAFVAALVQFPAVNGSQLSPAFWAILVALPLGKLVGITAGGSVAIAFVRRRESTPPIGDLLVVASLGGIGFTVSLLMNQLAWKSDQTLVDEGTLAVLAASTVSIAIGAVITTLRSRRYR